MSSGQSDRLTDRQREVLILVSRGEAPWSDGNVERTLRSLARRGLVERRYYTPFWFATYLGLRVAEDSE